jgi:hypothetical protein
MSHHYIIVNVTTFSTIENISTRTRSEIALRPTREDIVEAYFAASNYIMAALETFHCTVTRSLANVS